MTRRWKIALVAAVMAAFSAAPVLSATTASAMPLSTKVASVEAAQPGAGLAAFWSPDGKQANVFYVGIDGQIFNWVWNGTKWTNKALGSGEPAALGTGLAAYWSPDGKQAHLFYVGADGQLFNWYGNGTRWSNAAVGDGSGEPAALGTGLAAYWFPDGQQTNVFYVGADRQLYNWYGDGTRWTNAAVGNGSGEPAALARGLAASWSPDGKVANLFYVGINGQLYNWYGDGARWANAALGNGHGEPAGLGRGLTAFWSPDGKVANVFYMGADGQIFNWVWDGTGWTNSALGSGKPASQGTGLAAFWHPNGKLANVFYLGDNGHAYNGQVYNWHGDGTSWTNSQL